MIARENVSRVLVVADRPVFPIESGSSTQIVNWLRLLRREGVQPSLLWFEDQRHAHNERARQQALEHVEKLWVYQLPMGSMSRALHRWFVLLGLLLHGRVSASSPVRERMATRLQRRMLEDLERERFDAILVNKLSVLALVRMDTLRAWAPRIAIDIHDLHALHGAALDRALQRVSWAALLAQPAWRRFWRLKLTAARSRRDSELSGELAALERFDTVVAWSTDEASVLATATGLGARVVTGHYPIVVPDRRPAAPTHDLGFIGSGALLNCEAMSRFLESVWPSIRAARPTASLLVAGGVAQAVRQVAARLELPGITLLEQVADLEEFYGTVRVVIVPLLGGSGVSVKTIEALAYGAAVVATPAGARGLAIEHGVELLVAAPGAPFAHACVALLADEGRRATLSAAARRGVEARFRLGLQGDVVRAITGTPRAADRVT